MKLIKLTDDGHVKHVFEGIHDPEIIPDENRIIFSTGRIDDIGEDYLLVEDHIEVYPGQYVDETMKDYDQSHKYVKTDFQQVKEEIKDKVDEVKEEIKEFFDGDDDEYKG